MKLNSTKMKILSERPTGRSPLRTNQLQQRRSGLRREDSSMKHKLHRSSSSDKISPIAAIQIDWLFRVCLISLALSQLASAAAASKQQSRDEPNSSGHTTGLHASHSTAARGSLEDETAAEAFGGGRKPSTDPAPADELYLSSGGAGGSNHIRDDGPAAAASTQSAKLKIVRVLAPDAVQNGTQNVTIDCMFKFDKKLDRRLTIKWFFNDELEPIYQWIPELNKRVFSDRYERFLDKGYEVSQDVDFMLQAYRWLQLSASPSSAPPMANELPAPLADEEDLQEDLQLQAAGNRRQLANRLNKLAKLGGKHSRQLLGSLRQALEMDSDDESAVESTSFTRYRALRLIKPTTELNGRFTCSVSSLEGDDLRSKQLLVYEPAKSFTFTVQRVAHSPNQFNLTCQAGQVFPRPSLTLVRYRAGPPNQAAALSIGEPRQQSAKQLTGRPRLAATSLRQEPIADTRTHLTLSYARGGGGKPISVELTDSNDINHLNDGDQDSGDGLRHAAPSFYDISSWALVDEGSLSSYVVTQFECLLSTDRLEAALPQQQQRLSLALQKGWHVNSAALTSRSTLIGLFSALASLLCLMLAMVSSMLIFKLLKRHAKNRIHDQDKASDCSSSDGQSAAAPIAVAALARPSIAAAGSSFGRS